MKQTERNDTTATLGLGAWVLRPSHMWGVVIASLGIPTAVLVLLVFMLIGDGGEGSTNADRAHAAVLR